MKQSGYYLQLIAKQAKQDISDEFEFHFYSEEIVLKNALRPFNHY